MRSGPASLHQEGFRDKTNFIITIADGRVNGRGRQLTIIANSKYYLMMTNAS